MQRYALDQDGLYSPDISFGAGWDGETLMAMGALRAPAAEHGEVKSMRAPRLCATKAPAASSGIDCEGSPYPGELYNLAGYRLHLPRIPRLQELAGGVQQARAGVEGRAERGGPAAQGVDD